MARNTSRRRSSAIAHLPFTPVPARLLALRRVVCQSNDVDHDRYGGDVLSGDWRRPVHGRTTEQPAELGLVVEDVTTGWCGEIVRVDRDLGMVELEDRRNVRKSFKLGPGFWLDGKPVALTAPAKTGPARATRTASGSRAVADARAKVALPSRIWVEGRHDA